MMTMMTMMSWERLEKVIEWAGMSTHAFAMKIGMKRSENLYRIMRNKENVSIKLATLILEAYPQINKNWLVYGEGEMIIQESDISDESAKIPFYSMSVNIPIHELYAQKPTFYMYIPQFKDADLAVMMGDRAMEPTIPMGATLVLKLQHSDIIIYGHTYYVETRDMSIVRVIRKSETSDDELIFESVNNKKYDNITVKRSLITNLYLVCGTINRLF